MDILKARETQHQRQLELLRSQLSLLQEQLNQQRTRQSSSQLLYRDLFKTVQNLGLRDQERGKENMRRHQQDSEQQKKWREEGKQLREQMQTMERQVRESRIKSERTILKLQTEVSELQYQNKQLRRKLTSTLDELIALRATESQRELQIQDLPKKGQRQSVSGNLKELKCMVGALLKAKSKLTEGGQEISYLNQMSRISG